MFTGILEVFSFTTVTYILVCLHPLLSLVNSQVLHQ